MWPAEDALCWLLVTSLSISFPQNPSQWRPSRDSYRWQHYGWYWPWSVKVMQTTGQTGWEWWRPSKPPADLATLPILTSWINTWRIYDNTTRSLVDRGQSHFFVIIIKRMEYQYLSPWPPPQPTYSSISTCPPDPLLSPPTPVLVLVPLTHSSAHLLQY